MSRHSKNNTASSVFTYHERKQVEGCGSIHERLGAESLRRFEQCWICLKTAESPMATPEGYLFCRACIIFNFGEQKNEWKKQVKVEQKHEIQKKDSDAEEKCAAFERGQELFTKKDNLKIGKYFEREVGLFEHSDEEREIREMHERIKKRQERKRKRMVMEESESSHPSSVSFWAPHESHRGRAHVELISTKIVPPATQKLVLKCPITGNPLKFKDLVPIQPLVERNTKESYRWLCSISYKELLHQEVLLIKKTGKLVLKEVFKELDQDTKTAVINMKKGESIFSAHNKVQSTIFRPSIG